MLNRYLAQVLVTSLVLLSVLDTAPVPHPTCRPAHASPYAPRVIRRIRAALQLRVLEARRARLALAQAAIAHRMTIDQLLALPDDAAVLAQGPNGGALKHFHGYAASTSGQDDQTVFKPGWRSSRSEDENMCW